MVEVEDGVIVDEDELDELCNAIIIEYPLEVMVLLYELDEFLLVLLLV